MWNWDCFSLERESKYLLAATRSVELNPVKAGLVSTPGYLNWMNHIKTVKYVSPDLTVKNE